jgi:protoheme IX farnesyltransferase
MQTINTRIQFRHLLLAASLVLFGTIIFGGILKAGGTSTGCPDWPTCFGRWTPPYSINQASAVPATVDYLHRLATGLLTLLMIAAFLIARKREPQGRWLRRGLILGLGLVGIEIGLGAWLALWSGSVSQSWLAAAHLSLSLLTLAVLVAATVSEFHIVRSPSVQVETGRERKSIFSSAFPRLTFIASGGIFLLLVSGILVAAAGSSPSCSSWPLCGSGLIPTGTVGWIHMTHRLIVALTSLIVVSLVIQAWRRQRENTAVLVASTIVGVLFIAQALLGSKLVEDTLPYLVSLHQATAVGLWAALVALMTLAVVTGPAVPADKPAFLPLLKRKGLFKDLLALTKPVVVALLLVTTFAGMVIGARDWPRLSVAFWTLLGGFMAAGGSGAINQYIDREDDRKMQRTQKRPIPSGRLTPAEGLAFGVAIALASFYLMVAFVNILAALLTLAGIIYYVLIYSIFLKKTTVQNIVIGGGAGAIPPLVGWAAATGSLNIPSLFLFAVVFMWTPPHFWALALVRRKDYARAGVPMLPVVRGEAATRWQIFLYTLELVGLTLLLPLFGLGGALYLVGAITLGGWLLLAAWRVWKKGGNSLAWKMYRYSSMYLAFLFLLLMADRLL